MNMVIVVLMICYALTLPSPMASAQTVATGHYVPLAASGLKSGILPTRPGLIYQNSTLFYHTSSFRDDDGNEIGGADEVNVWANRNGLLWMTGLKVLGADYGAALAVPIANLAPNPVVVEGETLSTGIGIGDISLGPLRLGWHWPDLHVQSGYSIFVPTGRFKLNASDNTGKGFWTHMLHTGVTWMPKGERPWHVSLMTRYEMHSNQKDRDLVPGHTLTLDMGLGKKITDTMDLGLVGYFYRQMTATTGSDAINPLKYRSYGIGAEIQYVIAKKFPAKVRLGHDFEARNLSQGLFAILEFNFPL